MRFGYGAGYGYLTLAAVRKTADDRSNELSATHRSTRVAVVGATSISAIGGESWRQGIWQQ
jgi:hypothetical protein